MSSKWFEIEDVCKKARKIKRIIGIKDEIFILWTGFKLVVVRLTLKGIELTF